MKLNHYLKSLTVICLLSLYACSIEEDISVLPENTLDEWPSSLQLGEQLQNPYSVESMTQAWKNLQENDKALANESLEITPTHYYVKFEPETEEELDLLNRAESLELYSYPLDHEMVGEGQEYREPGLSEGQPTPQYASVPVDFELPGNVKYEILSDLFIPDNRSNHSLGRVADDWVVDELVHEALRITDNLENDNKDAPKNSAGRTEMNNDWRPAGRIRVWDRAIGMTRRGRQVFSHWEYFDCGGTGGGLGLAGPDGEFIGSDPCRRAVYQTVYDEIDGSYVGVHDLEVRARRWFTTHTGKTDINGNFTVNGTFKNDATYSLKWEKYHFSIRSGTFGQAEDIGSTKTGNWNQDYGDFGSNFVTNNQQFYALIFQAARNYYYGNRLGLKTPPENGTFQPQLKIGAFDKGGVSNHNEDRRLIDNWIRIYKEEEDGDPRNSERVYNTSIHELAHASHWELRKNNWDNGTSGKMKEGFAIGIGWALTRLRYPNHNWFANVTFDWMRITGENEDISLFIDLMDDANQGAGNTNLPFDRVQGFSIAQIEDVMHNSEDLRALQKHLKENYNISTDQAIDELFDQYVNLRR